MTTLVPDLSHWQGTPSAADFRTAAKHVDGFLFKATESTSFHDPSFPSNVRGARAAKLPVGAYVFVQQGSGAAQADFLLAYCRSVGGVDYYVVDWEAGDRGSAEGIVRTLKQNDNKPVVLYMGAWAREHGGEIAAADAAMVPSYGPSSLASAYKPKHLPLAAWQYTDGKYNGTNNPSSIPGIGACDVSEVYLPQFFGIGSQKEDELSDKEKKDLAEVKAFVDAIRKDLGPAKKVAPAGAAGDRVAKAVKAVEKPAPKS